MEKVTLTTAVPPSRPFQLVDAIILIAAAATWMTSMRHWWNDLKDSHDVFQGPPPWQIFIGPVHNGLWTLLWVLSAAYLVMRLIPPRPPWSDVIRQPGILFLGLMAALPMLIFIFFYLIGLMKTWETWAMIGSGLVLALLWIVASRRQRSRMEPGWIETFGRSVAIGWIVIIIANDPLIFLAFWLS